MDIANIRFLVVEDHGFQRWALGTMLQRLGALSVFAAPDGHAALAFVRDAEQPFDIVVSDIDMPGMDGMEFIRHLVQESPAASLIIVSGLDKSLIATVEAMARAYGAHVLGGLEKPATSGKLESLIRLHKSRAVAAAGLEPRTYDIGEIRAGLADGQFEPHFQPKVDLATRGLRGAEALARWDHTRDGLLLPRAFIGTVEEGGLIDDLTAAMVRSAARHCRAWNEAKLGASVSVNLSLASLADVSLADRMTDLVESEGLEPRHMIFEITESVAVSDIARALENLSRLRMKGFGLSIDDFGTGYSSMQRLARVPFTELKIDRAFVRGASSHPSSRAVLESSLEMAHKLGIPAVAEGVETEAEWALLRELGCALAQGYLVAPPMPAGEFLAWARR